MNRPHKPDESDNPTNPGRLNPKEKRRSTDDKNATNPGLIPLTGDDTNPEYIPPNQELTITLILGRPDARTEPSTKPSGPNINRQQVEDRNFLKQEEEKRQEFFRKAFRSYIVPHLTKLINQQNDLETKIIAVTSYCNTIRDQLSAYIATQARNKQPPKTLGYFLLSSVNTSFIDASYYSFSNLLMEDAEKLINTISCEQQEKLARLAWPIILHDETDRLLNKYGNIDGALQRFNNWIAACGRFSAYADILHLRVRNPIYFEQRSTCADPIDGFFYTLFNTMQTPLEIKRDIIRDLQTMIQVDIDCMKETVHIRHLVRTFIQSFDHHCAEIAEKDSNFVEHIQQLCDSFSDRCHYIGSITQAEIPKTQAISEMPEWSMLVSTPMPISTRTHTFEDVQTQLQIIIKKWLSSANK